MARKIKIITTDILDPWINLAIEEYLLIMQKAGTTALFLWQNKDTVVIGRNQNPWTECNLTLMETHNIKLARRISGGGAVFHDIGNLNFSFMVDRNIYDVRRQCGIIINALKELGINALMSGRNDILADDRKFSGNAFCFKGQNALHHGTILINTDMEKMARYLTVPKNKIQAKGVTSVKNRVINLCELKPELTVDMVKTALIRAFTTEYQSKNVSPHTEFLNINRELKHDWTLDPLFKDIVARNSSWEWRFGKTPDFDIALTNRFSWGGVELYFKLNQGMVQKTEIYSDALCEELISSLSPLFEGARLKGEDLSNKLMQERQSLRNLNKDLGMTDMVINDIGLWLKREL
jgi:lipoate-protein ligase A